MSGQVFRDHTNSTLRLVLTAMLAALTVAMQLLSNVLSFGVIQITLSLVPVVVGAILLGPLVGAILGTVLGAVNFISSFFNPVLLFLFHSSPVLYILTCFGKTALAGFVSGWLYRVFLRTKRFLGVCLASLAAPVVNTGVFFLMMILFFRRAIAESCQLEADANVVLFVLTAFIGFNFFLEFGINAILCPVIDRIVRSRRPTTPSSL